MSGGGLPAIPVYDIERHFWLHELRNNRAFKRVHGVVTPKTERKLLQKELCRIRKAKYK